MVQRMESFFFIFIFFIFYFFASIFAFFPEFVPNRKMVSDNSGGGDFGCSSHGFGIAMVLCSRSENETLWGRCTPVRLCKRLLCVLHPSKMAGRAGVGKDGRTSCLSGLLRDRTR
ncbi:hypothetical protein BDZ91DRAFT_104440 [Kalaharituber pfeilii]|nr:hypothetical protein BDZ91DRAFT_104440 [Kalaharituber pfeilii]